eukprot:1584861-Rhodomonas_salina.4
MQKCDFPFKTLDFQFRPVEFGLGGQGSLRFQVSSSRCPRPPQSRSQQEFLSIPGDSLTLSLAGLSQKDSYLEVV